MDDEMVTGDDGLGDVLARKRSAITRQLTPDVLWALGDAIQQWLIRHIARGIAPEAEGMVRSKTIEPQALFALADLLEEQGYPLAGIRMRRVIPQEGELLVFQYPVMMPTSAIQELLNGANLIKSQLAVIGRKVAVVVIPDTVSVTGFNVEGRQDAPAQG